MRINDRKSIETANIVHSRFGSWKAAKESAKVEGGKYVVKSTSGGRFIKANSSSPKANAETAAAARRTNK